MRDGVDILRVNLWETSLMTLKQPASEVTRWCARRPGPEVRMRLGRHRAVANVKNQYAFGRMPGLRFPKRPVSSPYRTANKTSADPAHVGIDLA